MNNMGDIKKTSDERIESAIPSDMFPSVKQC